MKGVSAVLNKLVSWEISGFVFVVIIGTLLHFVYDWSGHNRIIGIFAPVNESTWEHLKLLFVPMLLYSTVEYFAVGKDFTNFITAKSFGMILGLFAIVAAFYTYTGVIGNHFLWADILTFIFGVAVAYIYSYRVISKIGTSTESQLAGLILIFVFTVFFVVFTFCPPRISLFLDPVTQGYGI